MSSVLEVTLPVFGLMALGFFAGWFRILRNEAGAGLSDFVFTFCIPPLIFRTMATAVLPEAQPWGYWLAYFLGAGLVWALTMVLSRRVFGTAHGESVIAGFCASQSNTVLVGIPLLLKAYGDAGAVPLFLLLAVHLPIMVAAATVLIEEPGNVNWPLLVRRLLLNPILMSIFAGLLWRATGDRTHLVEAKRLLDELLAKNPAEHHATMLANVRVNREIVAAWAAAGAQSAANDASPATNEDDARGELH